MTYALITLLCVYLLWVHYVAVMRLMQVRDAGQLTTAMKAIGYPALVVGLLLDLIVNTVVATALFLELPKEFTVSARLTRHSEGDGWRQRVAIAIRTALLDNIDPNGVHRG
jgi:hypothetical protein